MSNLHYEKERKNLESFLGRIIKKAKAVGLLNNKKKCAREKGIADMR